MSYRYALAFLAIISLASPPAQAQQPTAAAARIVVIKPKEGMQKQFEEGYKRHLDWHRRKRDKWTWYGWQIVSGDRLGFFVDGTFGHRWEDFDTPVAPAEDAADNALNVLPYANFLAVGHYQLRPDVSNADLLEAGTPSAFLEFIYYHVRPGREREFEEVMRAVHDSLKRKPSTRRYSWYQLVNGGEQSTYILLLPHDKLSELKFSQQALTAVLGEANSDTEARRLLGLLNSSVRNARSELGRYRADLSYFPD